MLIAIIDRCTVQGQFVAKKSTHLAQIAHLRACQGNACRAKHQILGSRYTWSTISILRLSLGLAPRGSFQRRPGAPCPNAKSCQIRSHGDVTVFCGISSAGWRLGERCPCLWRLRGLSSVLCCSAQQLGLASAGDDNYFRYHSSRSQKPNVSILSVKTPV